MHSRCSYDQSLAHTRSAFPRSHYNGISIRIGCRYRTGPPARIQRRPSRYRDADRPVSLAGRGDRSARRRHRARAWRQADCVGRLRDYVRRQRHHGFLRRLGCAGRRALADRHRRRRAECRQLEDGGRLVRGARNRNGDGAVSQFLAIRHRRCALGAAVVGRCRGVQGRVLPCRRPRRSRRPSVGLRLQRPDRPSTKTGSSKSFQTRARGWSDRPFCL